MRFIDALYATSDGRPAAIVLDKIEIIWRQLKYRWRRFVIWSNETIDPELAELLNGYGIKFKINFA